MIGLCERAHLRRNSDARAGDIAILTKPLDVGIYSAAIKREALDARGYAEFIATTTRLNRVGPELAADAEVHAITDVTGFGLLGHGLELARGAGLRFVIEAARIPLLARAEALARDGFVTGASHRNWASYGAEVSLPENLPDWRRHILTDPQTSGGLLVTCAPARAEAILAQVRDAGFAQAAIVGRFEAGAAGIRVET